MSEKKLIPETPPLEDSSHHEQKMEKFSENTLVDTRHCDCACGLHREAKCECVCLVHLHTDLQKDNEDVKDVWGTCVPQDMPTLIENLKKEGKWGAIIPPKYDMQKLCAKVEELDSHIETMVDDLDTVGEDVNTAKAKIDGAIEAFRVRINRLDTVTVTELKNDMDRINKRIASMEDSIPALVRLTLLDDEDFKHTDERLSKMEDWLNQLSQWQQKTKDGEKRTKELVNDAANQTKELVDLSRRETIALESIVNHMNTVSNTATAGMVYLFVLVAIALICIGERYFLLK